MFLTDIKKGQELVFVAKLLIPGEATFRANPTIEAGDFTIQTWDFATAWPSSPATSALVNLATLPVVLNQNGSDVLIKVTASEMNHDVVVITARDLNQTGNTWGDNSFALYPGLGYATRLSDLDADIEHMRKISENEAEFVLDNGEAKLRVYTDAGKAGGVAYRNFIIRKSDNSVPTLAELGAVSKRLAG